MRTNTNIGGSLKNIRNYFGYTQQEIANQINIKRSLYSNYETNDCLIPLNNLIKLANFYKITVDSLLAFTDLEKNTKEIELNSEIISRNIKNIRNELNLSQKKLAELLNIGKSTIVDYEKQRYQISTAYIYDLSRLSGISVDWILGIQKKKYIMTENE